MTGDGGDRIIDEKQWRANVIDLKRCMSVAKSVFVQLEHSNEALLRVGVEIVTCRAAKKVMWWDDNWFANESKYNYFKDIVKEKLAIALGHAKGVPPSFLEEPSPKAGTGSDDPEVASLKKRLDEAEALARSAQLQQKVLEGQCREALERASSFEAAAERAKDSFKQMVKEAEEAAAAKAVAEYEAGPGAAAIKAAVSSALAAAEKESQKAIAAAAKGAAAPLSPSSAAAAERPQMAAAAAGSSSAEDKKRIAELERQLKQGQEERTKLEQKVKQAEKKAADAASEARAAQAKAGKPASQQEPDARHSEASSPSPTSAHKDDGGGGGGGDHAVKIDALEASLKVEKKRVNELREAKKGLEAELEKLRKELKTAGEKVAAERRAAPSGGGGTPPPPQPAAGGGAAEQAALPPVGQAPPTSSASGGGLCRRCGGSLTKEHAEDDGDADGTPSTAAARRPRQPKDAEMEELRRKAGLLDSMKARLEQKDEEIASLKEENAKLEDLRNRMGRMLSQVKDQLNRVTAIAEKRGYGKLIHEIMEEAEVTETINSAEYTCFTRLWEDALRRQAKQKSLQQQRQGGHGGEESRGGHFLKKKVTPPPGTLADFMGVSDDSRMMQTPEPSVRGHQDGMSSPDRDDENDASYKAGYESGYRAGYEAAASESGSRPATGSRKSRVQGVPGASPDSLGAPSGGLSLVGHALRRSSDLGFDAWDAGHAAAAAAAGDFGSSSPGLSSTAPPPGSALGQASEPRRASRLHGEADDHLEAPHRSGGGRRPSDPPLRSPLPPVETVGGATVGGRRPSGYDFLRTRPGSLPRASDGFASAQHHSGRTASLGSSVVDRSLHRPSKAHEGGTGFDGHGDRVNGGFDREGRRSLVDGAGFGADRSVVRPTESSHGGADPSSLGSSAVDRSLRRPSKAREGGTGLDRHGERANGGFARSGSRPLADGAGFGADRSAARPTESLHGGADHSGRRPSEGGAAPRPPDGGGGGARPASGGGGGGGGGGDGGGGGGGGLPDCAAPQPRDGGGGVGAGSPQRSGRHASELARTGVDRAGNHALDGGIAAVAVRAAHGHGDRSAHSSPEAASGGGSADQSPQSPLRPVTGPFRERARTPQSPVLLVGSSPGSVSSSTLPRTGSQQRQRAHGAPLTHSASAPGELPNINGVGVEGLGLGYLYGGSATTSGGAPATPPLAAGNKRGSIGGGGAGAGGGGGGVAPSPPLPEEARPLGPRGVMIVSERRGAGSPRPCWSPSPRVMWRPNKKGSSEIDVPLGGGGRAVAVIDPLPLAPSGYLPHGKVASTFPGAGGRRADALLDLPVEAIGTRISGE